MSLAQATMTPVEGVGTEIALGELTHPALRQGYDYWHRKRGERRYPARADVRPAEIKNLLPNLILVRVLDGGADFEFRIVGQANVIAHGFSALNWRIGDLDRIVKGYSKRMRRIFEKVVAGEPHASQGVLAHLERTYRSYQSLYLPLGPDDESVDHILTVAGYFGEDDTGLHG